MEKKRSDFATWWRCGLCGKPGTATRKEARRLGKRLHPGHKFEIYQCDSELWHYGHMPRALRRGHTNRQAVRAVRKRKHDAE